MGLHFQSVGAVGSLLTADLGLTYAHLGTLIGLYTVPGIFLALPGGLLGARFGDRAVILAALGLLTAGGALFANSASLIVALLGRVIVGAGGVMLSVQLTKVTTDWFVGKEISTALGLLLPTWPLGLAVALATLGPLATATSWQAAMYAAAAYSGVALLLVLVLYRDPAPPHREETQHRVRTWTISASELGLVSLASLSWMFLNAGLIVYVSFAPTLLMEQGYSLATAGIIVGGASLISIGSHPLAGYLTDRTRRPDVFIAGGAILVAATIFLLPAYPPALLWVLLFGLTLAGPVPAIVALPSEVLRAESRSTGFGAWQTVYNVGLAVVPPMAGLLFDVTHSASGPLVFAGALWLMIVPSLGAFRLFQRRSAVGHGRYINGGEWKP